jgi:hypothetical protein
MYPCTVTKHGDRAFIVDGEHWIPVSPNTTLEDAKRIHRDMFPSFYAPRPVKPPTAFRPVFTSHTVKSEKKTGVEYEVRVFPNGRMDCSCPGFKFRNRCKHVDAIKEKMNGKK